MCMYMCTCIYIYIYVYMYIYIYHIISYHIAEVGGGPRHPHQSNKYIENSNNQYNTYINRIVLMITQL